MTSVLVIGHADADGHLIAEQVRRNLDLIDAFDVDVVVDPKRTQGHRSWTKLDAITEIEHAEIVFFVDLMFGPSTFAEEAKALVAFVEDRPAKRFFLMDHHPLPLSRLSMASNLRSVYRPDVFECAIGPRSGMMVVAAICEKQDTWVADIRRPIHGTLARGVRRAAAHGGPLPGQQLLALLKSDRWDSIESLANESREYHKLPRGRRSAKQAPSRQIETLSETATELLAHSAGEQKLGAQVRRFAMAYDLEVGEERFVAEAGHRVRNVRTDSKDLEAIVTLLEVAAISLTTVAGVTFTVADLIREARTYAGDDFELDERDVNIVLDKATFVRKVGKELRLR